MPLSHSRALRRATMVIAGFLSACGVERLGDAFATDTFVLELDGEPVAFDIPPDLSKVDTPEFSFVTAWDDNTGAEKVYPANWEIVVTAIDGARVDFRFSTRRVFAGAQPLLRRILPTSEGPWLEVTVTEETGVERHLRPAPGATIDVYNPGDDGRIFAGFEEIPLLDSCDRPATVHGHFNLRLQATEWRRLIPELAFINSLPEQWHRSQGHFLTDTGTFLALQPNFEIEQEQQGAVGNGAFINDCSDTELSALSIEVPIGAARSAYDVRGPAVWVLGLREVDGLEEADTFLALEGELELLDNPAGGTFLRGVVSTPWTLARVEIVNDELVWYTDDRIEVTSGEFNAWVDW